MADCIKGTVMYKLIQGVPTVCNVVVSLYISLWLVGYLGCVTPADGHH